MRIFCHVDFDVVGALPLATFCTAWEGAPYCAVCSKCFFSLTNEYPNIFVAANYSQMNVLIYSVVYIFTNVCPNIFVHVVYSRMNV